MWCQKLYLIIVNVEPNTYIQNPRHFAVGVLFERREKMIVTLTALKPNFSIVLTLDHTLVKKPREFILG